MAAGAACCGGLPHALVVFKGPEDFKGHVFSSCLVVLWIGMMKNEPMNNFEIIAMSGTEGLPEAMSAGSGKN